MGAAATQKERKSAAKRWSNRAFRYGLSRESFRSLLVDQGHACAVCRSAIGEGAHVDHSHATGEVRGLLCGNCNTGLGLFDDSVTRLASAVRYLKRSA